jgi:hypothetical protein
MALEDLTPFGTAPKFYEGLLGPEETAALQKRAQIQGLLGAGLALAQGMSRSGAPRSALQNILGAAVGGFQSAGGAYQQGLQNFQTQQQIQQAQLQRDQLKLQRDQALALQQDVQKVMQTPEVANNPSLVALLRADPKEGLKWINENMAIRRAYNPQQQPTAPKLDESGKVIEVPAVTAPLDKRAELYQVLDRLKGETGEGVRKEKEIVLKQIDDLNKQKEIVRKQQDFTNEARRVAGYLFPNHDFSQPLNAQQSRQLNDELQRLNVEQKRAGATNLNVNLPTESERTAGYLTTRLKNSLSQYQDVVGGNQKAALPNLAAEVVKGVTRSDYLKNLVTPEDRQRAEAAQLDIVSAALTLSTGAAYTKEELEAQTRTYFPQLGDKPGTIRDKAVRLDKLLRDAAMVKAGRAAPAPLPSGGSLMNIDTNAIIQELEKRKKEGK